jgi:hypothetical protein
MVNLNAVHLRVFPCPGTWFMASIFSLAPLAGGGQGAGQRAKQAPAHISQCVPLTPTLSPLRGARERRQAQAQARGKIARPVPGRKPAARRCISLSRKRERGQNRECALR